MSAISVPISQPAAGGGLLGGSPSSSVGTVGELSILFPSPDVCISGARWRVRSSLRPDFHCCDSDLIGCIDATDVLPSGSHLAYSLFQFFVILTFVKRESSAWWAV